MTQCGDALLRVWKRPQDLLGFVRCSYRKERFCCPMRKRYCACSRPSLQEVPCNLESHSGIGFYRTSRQELRDSVVKVESGRACHCIIGLGTNQFIPEFQVAANLAEVPLISQARQSLCRLPRS